jgi:hypothetical protein
MAYAPRRRAYLTSMRILPLLLLAALLAAPRAAQTTRA